MNDLDNLKELLNNGIITEDEYNSITKRLQMSNGSYNETWEDVLNDFYSWCLSRCSESTAKGYKTCLYKFMLHMTQKDTNELAFTQKFTSFSFAKVNNFLTKMQKDGFGSQNINKTKYSISMLCKYLLSIGKDAPDISKIKVSITNDVNNTTIALTQDEIIKIANIGSLRSKVCFMLAYEGCLRRIELMNIKFDDFNFSKKQLMIYDKDKNLDRVCILSDDTVNTVEKYIDELYDDIATWNAARVSKGKAPREDYGYIFQSVKTTVPSYAILHKILKDNAIKYYNNMGYDNDELSDKVSKVSFETIRNSRKVYLLAQGVDVRNVMQMCGDKNYMSTYRFVKLVPLLYPYLIEIGKE